jgi:hypothetical protein
VGQKGHCMRTDYNFFLLERKENHYFEQDFLYTAEDNQHLRE